jgi:hypothetical protein
MAQENCKEVELNKTHQLLLYADHIKLLGKNIITITKNIGAPLDASMKVRL